MWRVEIDCDGEMTRVPVVSVWEEDAKDSFSFLERHLQVNAVVRLYAPGRLLVRSRRVAPTHEYVLREAL